MKDLGVNRNMPTGDHLRIFHPQRPLGLGRALMKAGYGTRKQAEQFVLDGRVQVDDQVVLDPRQRVGPENMILLDGRPLAHLSPRYFLFHKPVGTVCTVSDGPGRRLVESYLPQDIPGLTVVGRLDHRTCGLMLAANDRQWCRLLNGNPGLAQEYLVKLQGRLGETQLEILTAGVQLPKLGQFKPEKVEIVSGGETSTLLSIILGEGKGRHVRRVFSTLHHKVILLQRVRIGDVKLGDLKAGSFRQLTGREVEHLRGMAAKTRP